LRLADDAPEPLHQGPQKPFEPAQQQVEVEAGGGKDGVDSVAGAALEVVAAHAVFGLEVTDHRLDRGAALHFAADGLGDAADLAGDPDPEAVWIAVAAIAFIDMDALDVDAGQLPQIGDDRPQRVSAHDREVRGKGRAWQRDGGWP
jgi:hypothetical protein